MSRIWKTDKVKNLSSFIDFDLLYFNTATYMDRGKTIIASFENMSIGDNNNTGLMLTPPNGYDEASELSLTNNPYILYFDKDKQYRVHFYFNSIDGNIVGNNALVDIVVGAPVGLNKTVRLHSVTPAFIAPDGSQVAGEAWIASTTEDVEHGLDWNPDSFEQIPAIDSTWSFYQGSWTDTEITINKSKFWSKDSISPV